ncbi:hypothetical protein RHSIM_RhsimUnG0254500 [Rhododendron simsii]|uniref:Uncharacterized protein n=1 Tax=Rhododendron simsii TaxID=118357 RepID=A0A834FUX9_RHOSS|nr:hypothetical protein RHSIM_RhsimUnG0254500 [Rhododendron simsii]
MKSILKYVICCAGKPVGDEEEASGREDEVNFAVPTPLRETKRQKSRRCGTAKSVFPDQKKKSRFHWQPSLWAISENKVATERELVSLAGGPEKIILKTKMERSNSTNNNRSAATSNKVYNYTRSYSDTSGREGSPLMMPSFSPPIFIF